ncbi:MAG: protein kinase [Deltaproteobacteria bacterium]|nr:protein kinase [Deltaproteobacteria bacterium]
MTRNKHSGKVLDDRYEILSLLDEGGMGAVYLGRHVKLGRSVAVKFLHGELKGIKDVVARFYREARAASGISHPNIIDVYDVGVADWGEPYLVMEYLSGENLASLQKRKGPISLAAACGILEPALRALYAAHERGIVHRDLKPENIFLMRQENGPPVIKIIDFGVSKFLQTEQTQLTRTGALLGTPSYMSPEQARGRGTVDHRADIYSMGVVLHNMLGGGLPFVGESYNDLIVNILTEPAKMPTEIYPDFPKDAEPIVMRLLEKEPDKRFGTCMELLEALSSLEAFADRQAALVALTADMPQECVATGDLGDTEKFLDEVADTLYADMGERGGATVHDRPNGNEAKADDQPPEPTKQSTSRPAPLGRRSVGLVLLFIFIAVAVGIGLYATGLMPALSAKQNSPDNKTADVPSKLATSESLPAKLSPTESREVDSSVKEIESPGTELSTESESVSEDSASEDHGEVLEGTDSIPLTDTGEAPIDTSSKEFVTPDSPANASPADSLKESKSGAAPAAAHRKRPVRRATDTPEKQNSDDAVKPVASSEDSTAASPASDDASLSPLTPVAINRLLEARHGKVMTCYDIARAKDPEVKGILELKVGMAGNVVDVTVTGGNVSGFLSQCIIRVIKSTTVPPNDGTLVEILKEYEFR